MSSASKYVWNWEIVELLVIPALFSLMGTELWSSLPDIFPLLPCNGYSARLKESPVSTGAVAGHASPCATGFEPLLEFNPSSSSLLNNGYWNGKYVSCSNMFDFGTWIGNMSHIILCYISVRVLEICLMLYYVIFRYWKSKHICLCYIYVIFRKLQLKRMSHVISLLYSYNAIGNMSHVISILYFGYCNWKYVSCIIYVLLPFVNLLCSQRSILIKFCQELNLNAILFLKFTFDDSFQKKQLHDTTNW